MARMWGRQTPNWQVGKQINAAAGSESGVPGTMRVQPGRATFLSPRIYGEQLGRKFVRQAEPEFGAP